MRSEMRRGILVVVGFIVVLLAGCTSLLTDLGTDPLATQDASALEAVERASETMGLRERIVYRAAVDSPYYRKVSASIRPGSRPYIETPIAGVQTVVFSLELAEVGSEAERFSVYPYIMFVFDSTSRLLLDVYRVTPVLSERALTIESLTEHRTYARAMSDCVVAELEAARAESGSRTQVRLKDYLCDPNATSSYQLCVCVESVPSHFDQQCVDACTMACKGLACLLCLPLCWVPEYCIDYECTIIYPC